MNDLEPLAHPIFAAPIKYGLTISRLAPTMLRIEQMRRRERKEEAEWLEHLNAILPPDPDKLEHARYLWIPPWHRIICVSVNGERGFGERPTISEIHLSLLVPHKFRVNESSTIAIGTGTFTNVKEATEAVARHAKRLRDLANSGKLTLLTPVSQRGKNRRSYSRRKRRMMSREVQLRGRIFTDARRAERLRRIQAGNPLAFRPLS